MALLRNIAGLSVNSQGFLSDDTGGTAPQVYTTANIPVPGGPAIIPADVVPNAPQPNPIPTPIKEAVQSTQPAPTNVAVVAATPETTNEKKPVLGLIGLGASYITMLYPPKGVFNKKYVREVVFLAGLAALYYQLEDNKFGGSVPVPPSGGGNPGGGTVEPGGNGGGVDATQLPSVPVQPEKKKVCIFPGVCINI